MNSRSDFHRFNKGGALPGGTEWGSGVKNSKRFLFKNLFKKKCTTIEMDDADLSALGLGTDALNAPF